MDYYYEIMKSKTLKILQKAFYYIVTLKLEIGRQLHKKMGEVGGVTWYHKGVPASLVFLNACNLWRISTTSAVHPVW